MNDVDVVVVGVAAADGLGSLKGVPREGVAVPEPAPKLKPADVERVGAAVVVAATVACVLPKEKFGTPKAGATDVVVVVVVVVADKVEVVPIEKVGRIPVVVRDCLAVAGSGAPAVLPNLNMSLGAVVETVELAAVVAAAEAATPKLNSPDFAGGFTLLPKVKVFAGDDVPAAVVTAVEGTVTSGAPATLVVVAPGAVVLGVCCPNVN